jgi:transglutaminase-like putative cysteine protease
MAVATAPRGAGAAAPSLPRAAGAGHRRAARPLAAGGWPRTLACAALALEASGQWARQVSPGAPARAYGWTAVAVALGVVLLVAPRLARRPRPGSCTHAIPFAGPYLGRVAAAAAIGLATLAAVGLTLVLCGVPGVLLEPAHWDELGAGVQQGLTALPDVRVPYAAADDWVRTVILGGGGLLALLGVALAFLPRRGGRTGFVLAAALVLTVSYSVPVVQHGPDVPYASGALFAVLLAALLWSDRLAAPQVPPAAALGAAAIVAALLVGPRLDGGSPWIDYEHLAGSASATSTTRFDWNHRYTPLDWPRTGHEVLRVRAPQQGYWKGEVLEEFTGTAWHTGATHTTGPDVVLAATPSQWQETVTVVARDISSQQLYAPGTVLRVDGFPRGAIPSAGGTVQVADAGQPLKPGDSYRVHVYAPRPTPQQLRAAGTDYPDVLVRDLTMRLPYDRRHPVSTALFQYVFPFYGSGGTVRAFSPDRPPDLDAEARILASPYAREYRLAQRLAAESSSPYDLVRRVQARVREGATYSETPPPSALPLDDFLYGHREGYCQQYSGAMALLLRMAGVPARVASGFAPGEYDSARKEYVVRDLDAHSWVEVWFPGIGWTTFDPTPAGTTPATTIGADLPPRSTGPAPDGNADVPEGRPGAIPAARGDGGSSPWTAVLAAAALVVLAAAGLLTRRVVRRRRAPADVPAAVAELRRALARTGRAVSPPTTLGSIERRLDGAPEAQAYVRALRVARFGAAASPPAATARQRAALRRALGSDGGALRRVRAWLALPPRLPRRASP